MKRRDLLVTGGTATLALAATSAGVVAGLSDANTLTKHRKEQGFAAILDVAATSGEPRGTGISFSVPFSNYGPTSITYLIISEYNISDISITPPTPYGARFTIVARDPGEFECSIVWTAEE